MAYKLNLSTNLKSTCDALLWQESFAFNVVISSRSLLENSEAYCLGSITASEDLPIQLSPAQMAQIDRDVNDTHRSVGIMNCIKENMGDPVPDQRVVRHDQYQPCKARLRQAKQQVIEDISSSEEDRRAWEEAWPFDD